LRGAVKRPIPDQALDGEPIHVSAEAAGVGEGLVGRPVTDADLVGGSRLWSDAWGRAKKKHLAVVGGGVVVVIVVPSAVGALSLKWPGLLPYTYDQTNLDVANEGPSWSHWFGTDVLGRDLLVRIIVGGAISLTVGLVATAVSFVIGVSYGAVSGYLGG